jgi:hypothetical protein
MRSGDRLLDRYGFGWEGYERQVLSGVDLTSLRPWIILIEATQPRTAQRPNITPILSLF